MAAVINPYPPSLYHVPSYLNATLSSFYTAQHVHRNYYKPIPKRQDRQHYHPQRQQQNPRTPTPTRKLIEKVDSNIQQLRPRREPRIHRQVIVLPTPEPIYRQVRHRLPTPERQVIRRTVIQKANGEVHVRQERHRKKTRNPSPLESTSETQSPRLQESNAE